MILGALYGGWAGATGTPAGAPDVVVTSDCDLDMVGFTEVDGDGVDDLVLHVDEHLYLWPSGHAPEVWALTFPAVEEPWGDFLFDLAPATDRHGAQVLWQYDAYVEYEIDADSGEVTERSSSSFGHGWLGLVGDVDGDGWSDLANTDSVRLSSTSEWAMAPNATLGWNWTSSLGDLNGDGFDDLLVAWREDQPESGSSWCERHRGPADLYFGSPTGISDPPVWEMYALGLPNTGLGRRAVTFPGEDVLVTTIVEEGFECADGDFADGYLGLVVNASSPEASLAQVVAVEQQYDIDYMPELAATVGYDVVLVEPARVQWFGYDPATERLSEVPTAQWDLVDRYTDSRNLGFGRRPGRQAQALAYGSYVISTGEYELLVWGRTVDDVGPTVDGSSPDGVCTFWSKPYVEPEEVPPDTGTTPTEPTSSTPDDSDTAQPPPPSGAPEECGCASGPGTAGIPLVWVVVGCRRARRSRRS
jgi:FG-GAP repeat